MSGNWELNNDLGVLSHHESSCRSCRFFICFVSFMLIYFPLQRFVHIRIVIEYAVGAKFLQ